jgi:hypothetical protein
MPPYNSIAKENVLVSYVCTKIRTLTGYNTRNVLYVPDFIELPANFVGNSVQIKSDLTPFATGGGGYLQKIVLTVAILHRSAADPKYEWFGTLEDLNVEATKIRQVLLDFGSAIDLGSNDQDLAIRLYDNNQTMSPRPLQVEGGVIKECVWTAFQVWGVIGMTLAEYKALT